MSKGLKIGLIVLLVVVIVYFVYKKMTDKKPQTLPALPAEYKPAPGTVIKKTMSGGIVIDPKSGGLNVSNIENGLAVDTSVTTSGGPIGGNAPAEPVFYAPVAPGAGGFVMEPKTQMPIVSNIENGTDPDISTGAGPIRS